MKRALLVVVLSLISAAYCAPESPPDIEYPGPPDKKEINLDHKPTTLKIIEALLTTTLKTPVITENSDFEDDDGTQTTTENSDYKDDDGDELVDTGENHGLNSRCVLAAALCGG